MIRIINKILDIIIKIILVFISIISIYAIYDYYKLYDDSKLGSEITKYIDDEKVDIKKMKNEINEDICGWLRIDNTGIDYPLLHSFDNFDYLNKNYKKEYSLSGSLFLDSNNDKYFNDDYSIIYGHNVKDSIMFSDIMNYENINYLNKHNKGKLILEDKEYDVFIYSYNVLEAKEKTVYDLLNYKNNHNDFILELLNKYLVNKSDISINKSDKLLVLSTCNDIVRGRRSVLLCKLVETN